MEMNRDQSDQLLVNGSITVSDCWSGINMFFQSEQICGCQNLQSVCFHWFPHWSAECDRHSASVRVCVCVQSEVFVRRLRQSESLWYTFGTGTRLDVGGKLKLFISRLIPLGCVRLWSDRTHKNHLSVFMLNFLAAQTQTVKSDRAELKTWGRFRGGLTASASNGWILSSVVQSDSQSGRLCAVGGFCRTPPSACVSVVDAGWRKQTGGGL